MLVLRFETDRGAGIYRGAGYGYQACADGEHPVPNEDRGLERWWDHDDRYHYYCGFKDMEQATKWFPEEKWHIIRSSNRENEKAWKIRLVEYVIPREFVMIGERQVMFRKDKAISSKVLEYFDELEEV